MLNIAVTGAAGRMGQALIEALGAQGAMRLAAALERPGSPALGQDAGLLAGRGLLGIGVTADLKAVLAHCDLIIDFTRPVATLAYLTAASAARKPMVIGTTGFDEAGRER